MRGHEQGSCRVSVRRASLHEALVFGLPYRIFVCLLGLAIAMLSVAGVCI